MSLLTSEQHHTSTDALHDEPAPVIPLHSDFAAPLLEYHAEVDPDIHYIPKVTTSFAAGALAMGLCLNILAIMIFQHNAKPEEMVYQMVMRMAFVIGIAGVGGSLLLVGLKVRDDHAKAILFPRHWLNSLGTGALFSLLIWGPWLLADRGISFNRFLAAALWMCLMAIPGLAAFWVVGPRHHPARPD